MPIASRTYEAAFLALVLSRGFPAAFAARYDGLSASRALEPDGVVGHFAAARRAFVHSIKPPKEALLFAIYLFINVM